MSRPKASQMSGWPGSLRTTMPLQAPMPAQLMLWAAVTSGSVVTPGGMVTRNRVGLSPLTGSAGPRPCMTSCGAPSAPSLSTATRPSGAPGTVRKPSGRPASWRSRRSGPSQTRRPAASWMASWAVGPKVFWWIV